MRSQQKYALALAIVLVVSIALLPVAALAEAKEVVKANEQDSIVIGEGTDLEPFLVPDAYIRDEEVILINYTDGRIVIRDYAVGPGLADLSGKYDQWGGPYYDLAAGDFNGDGTKEIVAIGGGGITVPGPVLNTFDPVQAMGTAAVTQLSINLKAIDPINNFRWLMVRCGDVDGDGRDELIALRETYEGGGGIKARLICYEYEAQWLEKWNLPTGGSFIDITLGDFDSDNKADIAFAREFNYISVIDGENPALEYFNAQVGGLAYWNRIRIGDVNADNVRDLVLLRPQQAVSGNFPAAVLAITPRTANTWDDVFGWGFGGAPQDIELADTNLDGIKEIQAINNGEFAKLYILNPRLPDAPNNRTEQELWIGDREWAPSLVVGDVNGNGKAERLIVRQNGALLRIFEFLDNNGYADDNTNGPYWQNFITANIDGTGASVNPEMRVPNEVTLYYDTTAAKGTLQVLRVQNVGANNFTWTASMLNFADWLLVEPMQGAAGGIISFRIDPASPPGGSARADIRIVATCAAGLPVTNGSQTVQVTVQVVSNLHSRWLPLVF